MVSELSARLMQGYNFNNNAPSTDNANTIATADYTGSRSSVVVSPVNTSTHTTVTVSSNLSDHEPMMTIGACTAKLHQISTKTVPALRMKKARTLVTSSGNETCFKRRKVDELSFAASRVKEDLAKGGLSYPALDTGLRHHLDAEGVDTSRVSLVTSEAVSKSPFLTNNNSRCSELATMSDFQNLFSATFDCYNPKSVEQQNTVNMVFSSNATFVTNSSDGGSICSSMSDSDSYGIAPRLEDGLNGKNNNKAEDVEPTPEEQEEMKATALQRRAIYSNPITIRDAFENSNEARIVTLSFAPFLVVHVNPAYTRATGLAPADILGKPFHEVIEDPAYKANTAKASSLTSLHEKVTSFAGAKTDMENNNKFRVNVAVVGPEPADRPRLFSDHKNAFTHYMIALEEPKEEEEVVEQPQVVSTEAPTVARLSLVLPSVPILDTHHHHMPTMRLHCGVMG